MNYKKIAAYSLIGVGTADLVLGTTSTPLPILGDVLTQQLDAVLIGVGLVLLLVF